MTFPIWMALPPEVHSLQLHSGPGAGAVLAAAEAWRSLSTGYASAAAELAALLSGVAPGVWAGTAADSYQAAHRAYLAWLGRAGAVSAGVAADVETAAGAYAAALATMPTPAELAVNRATLGTLVATNFFGVNAVPIAVTEADYLRMWVQAATTMSVYQAVSGAALASVPRSAPVPLLLEPNAGARASAIAAASDAPAGGFQDPIAELLAGSEHFQSMYLALRDLVTNPVGTISQIIIDFAANPAEALTTWMPLLYVFAYGALFGILGTPLYAAAMAPAAVAIPIALGLSGVYRLAELPAPPADETAVPAATSPATEQPLAVAAAPAPAPAVAPAPAPASAPAPAPAAAVASAAPPTGPAGLGLVVAGGDGPRFGAGPTIGRRVAAEESASSSAATGAGLTAMQRRMAARRRRRGGTATERGYRYEFTTATAVAPATAAARAEPAAPTAAGIGAGPVGFTGTAARSALPIPAGLATARADTEHDATVPMMPGTWSGPPGAPGEPESFCDRDVVI